MQIIEQRRRNLGGFEVGRVLPAPQRRMIGPFIFFDHIGPVDFPRRISRDVDVRPHPHIGLSTITYLFEGEIMHRDSVGSEQAIRPAEVNWMIAGRGITHSERFEKARAEGGRMHGIQAWVALPNGKEEIEPSFAHYGESELPLVEEPGLKLRVIAGRAFGREASVTTHSPMFYVHGDLATGTRIELPDDYPERAIYVASGSIEVGGETLRVGQMVAFEDHASAVAHAEQDSIVMLLGGDPVGPRHIEWNFVSSSKERIEQAKADWRGGRMKLPDRDHDEFIPLPEPPPAPSPMS